MWQTIQVILEKKKKIFIKLWHNVNISEFVLYADPGCYDIVVRKLRNETNLSSRDITTIRSKFSSTLLNANVTETDG